RLPAERRDRRDDDVDPPNAPAGFVPQVPTDPRVLTVGVRWSIFALPDDPMPTRAADGRIGYFVETKLDFDHATISDLDAERDVVRRWRLDKADPSAARSKPVEPIRYYLDP